MPVREIPRSYRNLTGRVAMTMQADSAPFESPLERDFYVLLDFDPAVARVEAQPVRIDYEYPDGRRSHYTPDTLVEYAPELHRKPMLCEVKTRETLAREWLELKPRFKAAVRFSRAQGWIFRIFTEKEIRTPYLENVWLLRECRFLQVDELKKARIVALLNARGGLTLGELLDQVCPAFPERGPWLSLLWHLIATGTIQADLDAKLSYATHLSLSKGN